MVLKSFIQVLPSWCARGCNRNRFTRFADKRAQNSNPGAKLKSVLIAFIFSVCFSPFTKAAEVPGGFEVTTVLEGINAATAFTFTPDGRILILDQTGKILVLKDQKLLPDPMLELEVDDYWERGLIGITLHPDFPKEPHIFVNYTPAKPYPHHRISRFTVRADKVVADSEVVLFEGDDQTKLGGSVPHGHQGGPIRIGPDRKLYIALGEQTAGQPSQRLDSLLGKILRINMDGTIPVDNPFYEQTKGKYRAIWATGIRNPYGLEFHPLTAKLYENDVGQSAWEEINIIQPGANYGWPKTEGFSDKTEFTNPIHAYPPVIGRSITGGVFYKGGRESFPEKYHLQYFFADFMNHWIRFIDPQNPESSKLFAKNLNGPVDLYSAPDGSLYVLNRGTIWRDGKRHVANSGSLQRIRFAGDGDIISDEPEFARMLSETKLFDDLKTMKPAKEFHSFLINHPRWRPQVKIQQWMRIPRGKVIQPQEHSIWAFPKGTTIVQHFETKSGIRLETHVYMATGKDCFRSAAYHWGEGREDAQLVEDTRIVSHPDQEDRYWLSPGYEECLNLNTSVTGFTIELTTRQLAVSDDAGWHQFQEWQQRGWLSDNLNADKWMTAPKLVSLLDSEATNVHKVRSYLDANCASCHYPGGPSRGGMDARFQIPLENQNIIDGELLAGDLGIVGAKIVVPGKPEKSILYQRLKRKDFFRMPPVALNNDTPPILEILEEWIRSLTPTR